MNKEDRFYFDGLFYEDEESFYKAATHHARSQISPVSAQRILDEMSHGMALNLFNPPEYATGVSNVQLQKLCNDVLIDFVQKFRELHKENPKS